MDMATALADLDPTIRHVAATFHVPGYEPDDLLQEARLKILRSLPAFDESMPGNGRNWCRAVVRRRLIDLKRREERRVQPSLFEETMEELNRLKADKVRLIEFRESCTQKQQQVLVTLAQGRTQAELARQRGCSRQAVHRMLVRIRRKAVVCAA